MTYVIYKEYRINLQAICTEDMLLQVELGAVMIYLGHQICGKVDPRGVGKHILLDMQHTHLGSGSYNLIEIIDI